MISMLSSMWEGIASGFAALPTVLGTVILVLLFWPLILIYIAVMGIAYFSEIVFKKLAGIDPIYLNGEQLTGASGDGKDLVYGFITDTAVQNVFWSIVALSIVLLFICTIIALIKSEFTLDLKGAAKGPIIGRAFKSLVNFITIPVVTIIAVLGTNFLTKSIYDMFGGEDATIVTKCFYVGAYSANRARNSENFANALSTGQYSFLKSDNNVFEGSVNPFAGKSQEEVAYLIDSYFLTGEKVNGLKYHEIGFFSNLFDGNFVSGEWKNANWAMVVFDYPDETFSMINPYSLNFYYNLAKFDYVLAIGSAVVMAWLLLSVGMVLLKRVFELTILFLLAPAMTAIAPLDGGQAEKKWRGEFMKRLLAVIGPIFAYNMYFLMVPLFENISLFGGIGEIWEYTKDAVPAFSTNISAGGGMLGSVVLVAAGIAGIFGVLFIVFDVFFQLICIFVGLSIVKSASALLSALLGIDDLVKSGAENVKKAVDTGKKAALGATSAALMTARGGAALFKMGKAGVKSFFNSEGKESRQKAKEELSSTQEQYDAAKENAKTTEENLSKLEKDNIKGRETEYGELEEKLQALSARKLRDSTIDSDDKEEKDLKQKISDIKTGRYDDKRAKAYDEAVLANKTAKEDFEEATTSLDYRKSGISKAQQKKIKDIEDEKKEWEAKPDSKEKEEKIDELEKQKKTIFDNVDDSKFFASMARQYQTEFGKDSATESVFAKMLDSDVYKKVLGNKTAQLIAPTLTESLKQWLNPDNSEGNTVKRRMNDALAGMFGEGGGGELWKIWFNKNSRANLYEGIPESKKRQSKIEQSLSWGARDQWEQDKKKKEARKEQEKLIKRMLAEQIGGSFGKMYEQLLNQRDNTVDQTQIKKLDAKIEQMEVKEGLSVKARNYLDEMTPGSAKAKQLEQYKEKIADDATKTAAASELKKQEKSLNATVAAKMNSSADKPIVSEVKNKDDAPLKTKTDEKSSKKMGEDVAAGIQSAFEILAQAVQESSGKIADALALLTGKKD